MMLRILICFLSCVFATDSHINAIMEDIIRSIERTLSFYDGNKMLITLDDVFALRLLEGQILVMNNQLLGGSVSVSNDQSINNILPRLRELYQYSRKLSSAALNLLYRNYQWRSLAKSYIYKWPWTFTTSYRHLDPLLKWPADMYRSVNEYSKYEELCFAELLKSGFELDCSITGVCTKVMFSRGQRLRDAEQQLLYTLLAQQSGCLSELNIRLISSESVDMLQAELCTNIFFTISDLFSKNSNIVPPNLKGVFLKMALLCPLVGYVEFLHLDWLRQILSWQTSSGCWGSAQSTGRALHQKREVMRDKDQSLNRTTKKRFRFGVTSMTTVFVRQRPSRKQDAERAKEQLGIYNEKLLLTKTSDRALSLLPLPDGCVAPYAAIAIGVLSQYLRFCLLAPFSQINPVDYLFGTNYILNPGKLSTSAGEAAPLLVKTQRNAKAAALVRFGDSNLNRNVAGESRNYEIKNKVKRDDAWLDANLMKMDMKANPNPMVIDENDLTDEDGDLALEDQEDIADNSFLPEEVIDVVEHDSKHRGIQDGGYDSYYDNMNDENGGDQPIAWYFGHDRPAKLTHSSSRVMATVDSSFDAIMFIGRTDAVIVGIMFLFVWLLYKILLKRRAGLVYRYSHRK